MLENTLAQHISLNGEWRIRIGEKTGTIQVPGVWERQGYPIGEETAIYARNVVIPSEWADSRVYIRFGAVSYRADISVNGQYIGTHEGLWTAFEFDITSTSRFGETNHIELKVTKPTDGESGTYPFRKVLVGFIPYISITFGGPWQDVELIAYPGAVWKDVHITPDWKTGNITVQASVEPYRDDLTVQAEITDTNRRILARYRHRIDDADIRLNMHVEKPVFWAPESPHLYCLSLRLYHQDTLIAETTRKFGFRGLHANGEQLLFNGEVVYLRGILSWGWNPDTLAPVFTDEQIRDEFRRVRELGYNLYKLCLYVPQSRLFEIADEEGMFLWLELPMWWQILTDHLKQQTPIEYAAILAQVHHHPSVVIYSLGCELSADMADANLLAELDQITRQITTNALVCDNSGSGEAYQGLNYDFADFSDYHFYTDLHHFIPLLDHFRRDWQRLRPWIFGEFCFSDDLRDPVELIAADGNRLWWRDVFGVGSSVERWAYAEQEQRVASLNLPFTTQQLVQFSRRKSFLIRKITIEQTRTRSHIAGYVITGLRDTPISTAGMFDDFNRFKFDAEHFRHFNSDTVLMLEQDRSRVWKNGDRPYPKDRFNYFAGQPVSCRVLLSHMGKTPVVGHELRWELLDSSGNVQQAGVIPIKVPILPGFLGELGRIEWIYPHLNHAAKWSLRASLGNIENSWPMWVYPPALEQVENVTLYDPNGCLPDLDTLPKYQPDATGIVIASALTPEMIDRARYGGRVIVLQTGPGVLPTVPVMFWGTSLGLITDHPLLVGFPHDQFVDLQFYHLATDHSFNSDQFGEVLPDLQAIKPIIRNLDMRLFTVSDYLVEIEIGTGILIASTFRFLGGQGDQTRGLEGNPAGKFLLHQMMGYLKKA